MGSLLAEFEWHVSQLAMHPQLEGNVYLGQAKDGASALAMADFFAISTCIAAAVVILGQ